MELTITDQFLKTREKSLQICRLLSAEDCNVQSMPDASPIKWHLAHTTWFYETFVLEKYENAFQPFDSHFKFLFNSYYNSVGDQFSRPQRGMITRPSLEEVKNYRASVDERIYSLVKAQIDNPEIQRLIEIGIHHEQQHQELMMTDIQHLFSLNPLMPASHPEFHYPSIEQKKMHWISVEEGLYQVGHEGFGFSYDNETPRHRQWIENFEIGSRLVTNNEYLGFIEAGGYQEPSHWLSEGWSWIKENHISKPLYWQKSDQGWKQFSLNGLLELKLHQPVLHLSYFEADAFARWSKARLPTEFEWEVFAENNPSADQLFGFAWQWTSSSYAPYPGYKADPGALGEYNGKFMANQYVLRGSSLVTPQGHSRRTYRNFFPTSARWQFAGLRLARSKRKQP